MPRRKKERGRPLKRPYPPRIDASPEAIAHVVLNTKRPARSDDEPQRTEYRCADCDKLVAYPETLFADGRCGQCHGPRVPRNA